MISSVVIDSELRLCSAGQAAYLVEYFGAWQKKDA